MKPNSKLLSIGLTFLLGISNYTSTPENVLAQSAGATTANLAGTVRDPEAASIGGAQVLIKSLATGLERETVSSDLGEFSFAQLPPGEYTLTIISDGFDKASAVVNLALGNTNIIGVTLRIGNSNNVVEVTADSLTEARTDDNVNVTRQRIDVLPINRRDFLDFTLTSSRVVRDRLPVQGVAATSGLSFNGQSARFNNITIDGLDNNDIASGSVRSTFSQEAVQEFQVLPDGTAAEYGRALGGIVNIVTRGGSNQYHGGTFFLNRSDEISARDPFAKDEPQFAQYQFGATFSGPIKENKLFFFSSFERLTVEQSSIVNVRDAVITALRNIGFPERNGAVPFGVGKTSFLGRVDAQVTPSDRLNVRYNFGGGFNGQFEPFGGRVGETNGAREKVRDNSVAINNTYINTKLNLINETRFLYGNRSQNVTTIDDGPTIDILDSGASNVFGRNVFTPQRREERIYQIVNNVSLTRGINQIKFGIDFNYVGGPDGESEFSFTNFGLAAFQPLDFTALTGIAGLPVFTSLEALDPKQRSPQQIAFLKLAATVLPMLSPGFPNNFPLAESSLPLAFGQSFGNLRATAPAKLFATFVQDDIKLKQNLLVKVGLRYDINRLRFTPNNNGNFSPRIAFSYRPSKIEKLNIRASYGLFFGTPVFGSAVLANQSQKGALVLPIQTFPESIISFAQPSNRFPVSDQLPASVNFIPQFSIAFKYQPDLRNSYSQQISLGFDYLLNNQTLFSANYNFVRGVKLFAARRVNPIVRIVPGSLLQTRLTGRVDPTKGDITEFESAFDSYYHGLTIFLERRFTNKLGLFITYTLSKTIDNLFDVRTDVADAAVNTLRPGDERGLSIQDVRNRFILSGNWKLDYTKNPFLKDFQVSTILTLESGRPYNLLAGEDLNMNGDQGDRPLGLGRNVGITPGFANVDLRLMRTISINEKYQIQAFIEGFNIFNRFNLARFGAIFPADLNGNFNLPAKQDGRFTVPKERFLSAFPPRQFQFGVKVNF
ncbi:MAG: TonB-dependent receptor [Acidobacteria bacterium]|nr:TonB-dependent receptor [Acidobacteriota bacterium]